MALVALWLASFYKRKASDLSYDLEVKGKTDSIAKSKDEIKKEEESYEKDLAEYRRARKHDSDSE